MATAESTVTAFEAFGGLGDGDAFVGLSDAVGAALRVTSGVIGGPVTVVVAVVDEHPDARSAVGPVMSKQAVPTRNRRRMP